MMTEEDQVAFMYDTFGKDGLAILKNITTLYPQNNAETVQAGSIPARLPRSGEGCV